MSPAKMAKRWWCGEDAFTKVLITVLSAGIIGMGSWLVSLDRAKTEYGVRIEGIAGVVSRLDAFESKFDRTAEQLTRTLDDFGQRLSHIEGAAQRGR